MTSLCKLDALFAERVMGWHNRNGWLVSPEGQQVVGSGKYPDWCEAEHIKPTTNLSAAWAGVERLGWADLQGPISKREHPYHACVEAAEEDGASGRAFADSPALAIVLACLRAAGTPEEEIERAIHE